LFGEDQLKVKAFSQSISVRLLILTCLIFSGFDYVQAKSHKGKHKTLKFKQASVSIPNKISEATVVLLTPTIYETEIREESLKRLGCKFITKNTAQITKLIRILKNANIRAVPYPDVIEIEENYDNGMDTLNYWEGIYLVLPDGTEVKLLLGYTSNHNKRLSGGYYFKPSFNKNLPESNGQFVVGKPSLQYHLFDWAAETGKPTASTKDHQKSCDLLMGDGLYKKYISKFEP
jgi:hypothetical protein